MDHIFAPLKRKYPGLLFIYMDDILIATGEDIELHRCIVHDVTYLGIIVEAETIRIDPTKINGLLSWP